MSSHDFTKALLEQGLGANAIEALTVGESRSSTAAVKGVSTVAVSGDAALRLARRSALWAACVAAECRDEDTLFRVLDGEKRKVVMSAAALNQHLSEATSRIIFEWAIASSTSSVLEAMVQSPVLPVDVLLDAVDEHPVVANLFSDSYLAHNIAAERFDEATVLRAARSELVTIAVAAVGASRGGVPQRPGSVPVAFQPALRRAVDEIVAARPDREAFARKYVARRFSLDRELCTALGVEAVVAASAVSPVNLRVDESCASFLIEETSRCFPERFARLVQGLGPRPDRVGEFAASDSPDVAAAAIYSLDSDGVLFADEAEQIASKVVRLTDTQINLLMGYSLSDAALLNVLRCGDADNTASWLLGKWPKNPANVELVAELNANLGNALSNLREVRRSLEDLRLTAWVFRKVSMRYPVGMAGGVTDAQVAALASLDGILSVDVGVCDFFGNSIVKRVVAYLVSQVTERYGDDPAVWQLVNELGKDHAGSVDDLLDMVDAAVSTS